MCDEVYKKKQPRDVVADLFEDVGETGELFKDEPMPSQPASESVILQKLAAAASTPPQPQPSMKNKLLPEARRERYDKLLDFVKPRLGRKPEIKMPQVRTSAWTNLVNLATTEEQLRELAGLFPSWTAAGRKFDSQFSELFVSKHTILPYTSTSLIASPGRCEQLSCPLLALDVFGNYAKYNLKLTLPGARQLLHSLHLEHPIDRVIAASALYSVYSLIPIAQDLVSCSMLVSACFKHNSEDSLIVARSLLPHLHDMLSQTKPSPVKSVDKSQAWLQWTLKKIDKAVSVQNNSRAEWLRDWRLQNGHILEPSRF